MKTFGIGPAAEALLARMPSRARAGIEVAFVAATVFASTLSSSIVLPIVLFVIGVALVRPWSAVHGSPARRVFAAVLLIPALGLPLLMERPVEDPGARRIGIQLERVASEPGDPEGAAGVAKVASIVLGSPAEGHLVVGDRIVLLGGQPLDKADPTADVIRRVQSHELPVDTTIDVVRGGVAMSVPLHLPWPPESSRRLRVPAIAAFVQSHLFAMLALRGVAGIALAWLLVRANGQTFAELGIRRQGAGREILRGFPGAAGAILADVVSAIPALLASAVFQGALERDMGRRTEGLGQLLPQGGVLAFGVTAIFAASFEEVVFRGFLAPRLRHVTGSWIVAVLISSVVFASGHVYEGTYALFQTFVLGVYFSWMFLSRARLEAPIAAHAIFNTVIFAIAKGLSDSGLLDKMQHVVDQAK